MISRTYRFQETGLGDGIGGGGMNTTSSTLVIDPHTFI